MEIGFSALPLTISRIILYVSDIGALPSGGNKSLSRISSARLSFGPCPCLRATWGAAVGIDAGGADGADESGGDVGNTDAGVVVVVSVAVACGAIVSGDNGSDAVA